MNVERTRILFLVSTLRQAGPTTQLLNILKTLDHDRFDPVVVTLSAEPACSMRQAFEDLGTRVESLLLSRTRGMFHRSWREDIGRLAGAELNESCVVHSQGIRADIISSTKLTGVARVATARNYPYDDYVMKFGRIAGGWMARRHIRAFRVIPNVVACSSTLARQLRTHGVETTVIRNGVDTVKFSAASATERSRLREQLNLTDSASVGVCVGSLVERKNPLSIVRAARAVDSPELVMMFVGAGTQETQCRRAAEGDRRIRFAGHADDVLRYLQAADFFVSASRSEGMPNSALEALACGLPLVLSDIEPHRELLELAPTAGALFAPDETSALANAIRRATASVAMMRGLLPGQAAGIFGAERVSQHYQELYLRLACLASTA